jgi:hypothetical protein
VILGLDHLAIAVGDPDAAVSELASILGLPAGTSGGRHLAWGTRNRLLWLGDSYIELVTVYDPRLAERSWLGRAALPAVASGDPAPVCWAISTDDIDLDRSELNAAGAALAPATAGERRRPDGEIVRWRLALPPKVDLESPFLIEHDTTAAEWTPDDRDVRSASPARLLAVELPVEGVSGLADARIGARLGDQLVRAIGAGRGPATLRIGGLMRGGSLIDALGCRWLLD